MAPHLRALYAEVQDITGADSFIEGGDILVTETEILVGRSARTNAAGIAELARRVAPWGHRVQEVHTPPGVLHFKTDCSLMDAETILATDRLAASGCFAGYRVIPSPRARRPPPTPSASTGPSFSPQASRARATGSSPRASP